MNGRESIQIIYHLKFYNRLLMKKPRKKKFRKKEVKKKRLKRKRKKIKKRNRKVPP